MEYLFYQINGVQPPYDGIQIYHLPMPFFVNHLSLCALVRYDLNEAEMEAIRIRLEHLYETYHRYPSESHRQYMFAHLIKVCATHMVRKGNLTPGMEEVGLVLWYIKRIMPFESVGVSVPAPIQDIAASIGTQYGVQFTQDAIRYIYEAYDHLQHPKPSLVMSHLRLLYLAKKHQLGTGETGRLTMDDLTLWIETTGCMVDADTDEYERSFKLNPPCVSQEEWKHMVERVFDSEQTCEWFYYKAESMLDHLYSNRYWLDQWATEYGLHGLGEREMMTAVTVQPATKKSWADEDSEDDAEFFRRPLVFRD